MDMNVQADLLRQKVQTLLVTFEMRPGFECPTLNNVERNRTHFI